MSEAHRRKKAPDQIRRSIVESAARLAARAGLSSLSVQAIAAAAGVTKGGFFHHFPSKQAMVDALFAEQISGLDRMIDAELAAEPDGPGCFTRAYVRVLLGRGDGPPCEPCPPFSLSMLSEPALNRRWSEWIDGRLARHAGTDGGTDLEVVRLAADGFWLARMTGSPLGGPDRIRAALLALTQKGGR